MYCMDANSFITGWKTHYLPSVFPTLWDKIAMERDKLIIIKPIYDEIEPLNSNEAQESLPELAKTHVKAWLMHNNFQPVPINDSVELESIRLEAKYQISPNSRGANKNDITLIAYAKMHNIPVVTFEGKQSNSITREKYNYKIPLICQEENVECIVLPECLKRLGIII